MEQIPTAIINPGSVPPPEAPPNLEADSTFVEEAQVAWHGVKAFIAERRMNFSGSRMEKMDHKEALYSDLGAIALTGEPAGTPTANGEPAMPRTAIERRMDRKIDKRAVKARDARIYANRAEFIFGPQGSSDRLTTSERRDAKFALASDVKRGSIRASEARIESTKIGAQRLNLGEGMHKRTSKNQSRAAKKLDRAIDQPILSRWRGNRAIEAVSGIQRHHNRAEEHKAKVEEIRDKQENRRLQKLAMQRSQQTANANNGSNPPRPNTPPQSQFFDQEIN